MFFCLWHINLYLIQRPPCRKKVILFKQYLAGISGFIELLSQILSMCISSILHFLWINSSPLSLPVYSLMSISLSSLSFCSYLSIYDSIFHSHQTRLDTRSKTWRLIKVGIKGKGRSGTSRDSNPAGVCSSLIH